MSEDRVVRGWADKDGNVNVMPLPSFNRPVVVIPADEYEGMISRDAVREAAGRAIEYSMVVDGDEDGVDGMECRSCGGYWPANDPDGAQGHHPDCPVFLLASLGLEETP